MQLRTASARRRPPSLTADFAAAFRVLVAFVPGLEAAAVQRASPSSQGEARSATAARAAI